MSWVASAGLAISLYAGSQAADAQNELSDENWENAILSQTYENRGLNERQREEDQITADKKLEATISALQAKSSLQAKGKNIAGVSMDRQAQDVNDALSMVLTQLNDNASSQRRQLDFDKEGASSRAQSRINSVPKTSYDPTMDIAKTGLSIYGGFKDTQSKAKIAGMEPVTFGSYVRGDWR